MSSLLWQPQVSAYRRLAFGTEFKWVCVLMPIGHKWAWQSERPTSIQVCSSLCMCEWRNLWMRAHTVRGRSNSEFALVEQFVTLQIYPLIQTKMVTGMAFFYSNPGHTSEGQCRQEPVAGPQTKRNYITTHTRSLNMWSWLSYNQALVSN